jgi:two-component system response regulator FixJ
MTDSAPKRTVYIVDDDEEDRQTITEQLADSGLSLRLFSSGLTFIEEAGKLENACVILDVRMPDIDGLTLVKHIVENHPGCPVIMLSGKSTLPVAVEAMKRGAVDFLEKPVAKEALLAAIERAFALRPQNAPAPLTREQLLSRITRREGQVLELLVQGDPNKVVAYKLGIAENTVEVHRQRLMKRLNVKSFAELVRIAVGAGI